MDALLFKRMYKNLNWLPTCMKALKSAADYPHYKIIIIIINKKKRKKKHGRERELYIVFSKTSRKECVFLSDCTL